MVVREKGRGREERDGGWGVLSSGYERVEGNQMLG